MYNILSAVLRRFIQDTDLMLIVEQILSSPGLCFCPLILRMADSSCSTITSSMSPSLPVTAGLSLRTGVRVRRLRGILWTHCRYKHAQHDDNRTEEGYTNLHTAYV